MQRYTLNTLHPKAPLYYIIIIVDTVLRQKQNFEHERQLSQQYLHIATLACMTNVWGHTSMVRNVKIALFEKIILLHPRVDVPYSFVVV